MEYIAIGLVAFAGSLLTFFSGFGLGTLLLPAFGLFFPVESAIALTAIVHFLNNLFKLGLIGKHADRNMVLTFGLPSLAGAWAGAWCLRELVAWPSVYAFTFLGRQSSLQPVKLTVALLLVMFSLIELWPVLKKVRIPSKWIPAGGLLSGFFGGLSGHQGALRSAFLIQAGMGKEVFIATGVWIACMVDVTRLTIYLKEGSAFEHAPDVELLVYASLSAFMGSVVGKRFLGKITIGFLQYLVAAALIVFSFFLAIGWT
jgi:hypothetical protein